MSNTALNSCKHWFIYNPQTKEQLGPMTTEKLKEYLLRFDPVSQSAALVRCPLWKDPRRGDETLAMLGNLPNAIPEQSRTIKVLYENSQPLSVALYPVARKFVRVKGALNVSLISKGRCLRTRTDSLSMGGMGFAEEIPPEMFSPSCKAVLSIPNATEGIVATLKYVANQSSETPVRCASFEELRGTALTTYMEWLKNFEK